MSKHFDPKGVGAFLIHDGTLFFSGKGHEPADTAVTALIRGLCALEPRRSIALTRERIFCDYEPKALCAGMVKVAGKRIAYLAKDLFLERLSSHCGDFREVTPPPANPFYEPLIPKDLLVSEVNIKHWLEILRSRASGRTQVSAILSSAEGRVLAYSWSQSLENRTNHAELQLIHSLYAQGEREFPRESTLWISLRPCSMCSAQILAFSRNHKQFRVRFLDDDKGPAARNSCLFPGSQLWRLAGSPTIDVAQI